MGEALQRRLKQVRFESPHHEAFLNLMVAAAHVRAQIDAVCAEHGITEAQYNVLRILRGSPEGYPRCDITDRMVERAPDVTRLIDRLEQQQLVERERSGRDKRLSITRISRKGLELLERMQRPVNAIHEELVARVSTHDARELSRILESLYGQEAP